jgi:hypothetical protein
MKLSNGRLYMKNKIAKVTIPLVILLLINSCAPGNEKFIETPAGFWMGFWHGVISVVTLIVGIFDFTVKMYEVNNSGWWYDFGFLLGAGFSFSNIWFSGSKAKKHK